MHFLIVDQHRLFMEGIRLLLQVNFADAIVDTAHTPAAAVKLLDRHESLDLILLNLDLPNRTAFTLLHALYARHDSAPVMAFSVTQDPKRLHAALDLGVRGIIPMSYDRCQAISAIRQVLEERTFIPHEIQEALAAGDQVDSSVSLSHRQRQVLGLIHEGHTNRQIADLLELSESTIKSHVSALFDVFNAGNRTECLRRAYENGLL